MQINVDNIKFNSFSDGVCDIYTEDEEGNKTMKYENLGFNNKTLGYNRVFAAKAAQTQVNEVIKIPKVPGVDIHDILEIKGIGKYDIELSQELLTDNPPSILLTLRQLEMFEVKP